MADFERQNIPRRIPIFSSGSEVLHADTCRPLADAAAAGDVRLAAHARGAYPGERLPKRVLTAVRSVGYWDAARPQQWGLDWHRNEGLELTFLERGRLAFATRHAKHTLTANDLTITRPWQLHRVGDPWVGAGRLHWLILDLDIRRPHQRWNWPDWVLLQPADVRRLTHALSHCEQPVWRADPAIRRCFAAIAEAVDAPPGGRRYSALAVRINELLLLLLEVFTRERVELNPALSTSLRTVELFLDELVDDEAQLTRPWSTQQMAVRCGLGLTRFSALVKQLTSMTAARYLAHRRVEHAKQLLANAPQPDVTRVALRCGFSSSQYFATVFRRHTGQTPTDFMRVTRRC